MEAAAPRTGFRRVRYSDDTGTGYDAIFRNEYHGSAVSQVPTAGDTRFEYTVAGDDDVSFRTMRARGGRRHGTLGPLPSHVVVWLTAGTITLHVEDQTIEMRPGKPAIVSAGLVYTFDAEDTEYSGLHVADSLVRRVADRQRMCVPPGPLRFDQQDDAVAALAPLRTLMQRLGPVLVRPDLPPEERAACNEQIAMMLLDTFPVRFPSEPGRAHNRLRDAVAWIRAHAGEQVALEDVARAAGLSDRGTQELFRRSLDTTPLQFLRDVRVAGAHRDLVAADPEHDTVGEIARRWGFTHLGRFAATYRERYGMLPAEALRRRQR